jgi:hypothetical protein
VIVLYPREALFLRGGDDVPVRDECGSAIVIEGGDAEDEHGEGKAESRKQKAESRKQKAES